MKVLVDTNVVLDVILNRASWVTESARILAAIELGKVDGFVAAHAITTIYYITSKQRDAQTAKQAVMDVLRLLNVVPLEHVDFNQALLLNLSDFEDAVQAASAMKVGADYIVTRNQQDFAGVPVPAEPPGIVLGLLALER